MRNISHKRCRDNQSTHFMFNNIFRKLCLLWDNVEKYFRAQQATDDKRKHVHCMLVTWGSRHTLRIYNTYCFFLLQQWLHERASVLRSTYNAGLVWLNHIYATCSSKICDFLVRFFLVFTAVCIQVMLCRFMATCNLTSVYEYCW